MMILVNNAKREVYASGNRYFYADLSTEKQSAYVVFEPYGVRVIVQNSSHKCWRGLGKKFQSVEAAVANYKTASIKAMIQHAAELNAAAG